MLLRRAIVQNRVDMVCIIHSLQFFTLLVISNTMQSRDILLKVLFKVLWKSGLIGHQFGVGETRNSCKITVRIPQGNWKIGALMGR